MKPIEAYLVSHPTSPEDPRPEYVAYTRSAAIRIAKLAAMTNGHDYANDEQALADFMTVQWAAKIVLFITEEDRS